MAARLAHTVAALLANSAGDFRMNIITADFIELNVIRAKHVYRLVCEERESVMWFIVRKL